MLDTNAIKGKIIEVINKIKITRAQIGAGHSIITSIFEYSDNAIDAGATNIDISIKEDDNVVNQIMISDNGCYVDNVEIFFKEDYDKKSRNEIGCFMAGSRSNFCVCDCIVIICTNTDGKIQAISVLYDLWNEKTDVKKYLDVDYTLTKMLQGDSQKDINDVKTIVVLDKFRPNSNLINKEELMTQLGVRYAKVLSDGKLNLYINGFKNIQVIDPFFYNLPLGFEHLKS